MNQHEYAFNGIIITQQDSKIYYQSFVVYSWLYITFTLHRLRFIYLCDLMAEKCNFIIHSTRLVLTLPFDAMLQQLQHASRSWFWGMFWIPFWRKGQRS